MNYITFPIKLYTGLNVNTSIILSAIEASLILGCNTKEERTTYVYGFVSHVLTTVSIRNNIKQLIKMAIIDENLIIAPHILDVEQLKTINRVYGSPGRKHKQAVEENAHLINSLQDAH